jgi:ATP-dependent RNA circularization protein (DNA/RNA ligase family)
MEYPKINNLYKRITEGPDKGRITYGDYTEPEFESIDRWKYTEKIDGTNVRIIMNHNCLYETEITILGKTDRSVFTPKSLEYLKNMFSVEKLLEIFDSKTTIFGELFGKGIQEPQGSIYNSDGYSFMIFDILMEDENNVWWLEFDNVQDIAKEIGVESVPILGIGDKQEIFEFVRNEHKSTISDQIMEGVVATSYPMMYYRKERKPIRFKLKVKDIRKIIMEK